MKGVYAYVFFPFWFIFEHGVVFDIAFVLHFNVLYQLWWGGGGEEIGGCMWYTIIWALGAYLCSAHLSPEGGYDFLNGLDFLIDIPISLVIRA